nr:tumor necrosis factor receptor superfamily member 10B isoform X1 [Dasypus novemcinctus]
MAPRPRHRFRGSSSALWGPGTLFLVTCHLLLVRVNSAPITQQSEVQRWMRAPSEGLCPAGSHVADDGRNCTLCQNGVEYTSHWNSLSSCLPCTVCKPDEDETGPCTPTRDTECRCKDGTFRGVDVPEFCQKCKTRCPDEMVEASPCTPWKDLQCVHQGSGTRATGEATVSREPGTRDLGSPASPSPPSGGQTIMIVIGCVVGLILVGLIVTCLLVLWKKGTRPGCGEESKCLARVIFCWSFSRGREAQDNATNQMLSDSLSTLDSAQGNQGQEKADLPEAAAQIPGEGEPLLDQKKDQKPQRRKMVLVVVNGADPSETLRLSFSYFTHRVPINSWTPFMRLVGLTDNEVEVAKKKAGSCEDELYEMLSRWLRTMGRDASVNTLLCALERRGEREAMEKIQDDLVNSGLYVYQECGTDSLCCEPGDENTASGNQSFAH